MAPDMNRKIVAVTGGTTGIGLEIAKAFMDEGAQVAVCSSDTENVKHFESSFVNKGYSVFSDVVDVTDKNQFNAFVNNVQKEFGGIDIWVNNAAVCPISTLTDTSEETYDKCFSVNVKSIYYSALYVTDIMKERGGGSIINAASFAAIMPSHGLAIYSATKAAVYSLTKTMAAEFAPFNIRVNGYMPGVIQTRMVKDLIKQKKENLLLPIALKRFGKSEEVAKLVLFLASDQASYITGALIDISGGKFCVQNPQDAWV